MENIQRSIYIKLNELAESELKNDDPDTDLIKECVDGMLRLMPESSYQITSAQREKNIQRIFEILQSRKTKTKIGKIILIAAIIIALIIGSVFAYTVVEYKIHDYGIYSVVKSNFIKKKIDKPVIAEYIPEGFELTEEFDVSCLSLKVYSLGEISIAINKSAMNNAVINTEYEKIHTEVYNDIDYMFYGEEIHGKGVIWYNNGYCYVITGPLPNKELFKIAKNVN